MFKLDNKSNDPLYIQIVNQTKQAIVKGILKNGDIMPSVRELSKSLLINTSTVSKAYKQLSELGILETLPGTGSFISIDRSKLAIEKEITEEKLKAIFLECRFLGIKKERIDQIYEESELDRL